MKNHKLSYILLLIIGAIAMVSCKESNGNVINEYTNWQARNDTYFAGIYSQAKANVDGNWKIIHNYAYNDSIQTGSTGDIVVHVLNAGTGSGSPLFTDTVRIDYQGKIMPTDSVPTGKIFDATWIGTYNLATMAPAKLAVGSTVDGFATALMNMHIGDRWQVYIPYTLGYGNITSGIIPAYSTLIFDITLRAYYRAGTLVPDWKAKQNNFSVFP